MRTMPLHGTTALSALRPPSRTNARKRLITGVAVVALATALSSPAWKLQRQARRKVGQEVGKLKVKRKFLPPFLADAVVGALGEIGQLAVLYPLDTIKVRSQAQGASTRAVWAGVCSQGFSAANLSSLFAGCAPSAVCAALIGACYLASFCAAKRFFVATSKTASHSISTVVEGVQESLPSTSGMQPRRYSDTKGAADQNSRRDQENRRREQQAEHHDEHSAANDTAAALVASLLTSILEAPVELFRHRMQAGLSHGRMLSNMASAFGGEGLASLYWGYAPFLLKGIPYDVAELISYSQLTKNQQQIPVLSSLPLACRDCIIGAMAGAAAVIFSMPADCVKTRMELGTIRPPNGLIKGSAAFFSTGQAMLRERGAKSMFVGLVPRLLENVPSTMFYWVLVASLRRALKPYINDSTEAPTEAAVL